MRYWTIGVVGLASSAAIGQTIEASFTGGSILVNGFASAGGDFDEAHEPGSVSAHSASGGGITSSGYGDDFAEGTVSLDVEIVLGNQVTMVEVHAEGDAFATSAEGYADVTVGVATQDLDFNSTPLLLEIVEPLFYEVEGSGVTLTDANGDDIEGQLLQAGTYRLSTGLYVSAYADFGEDADSAELDWVMSLARDPFCEADVNADGVLDILDFAAFQQAWLGGDPLADCTGDGVFDILDFVCFQGVFGAGCD